MKIHGTTGSLATDGVLTPKELAELNESQLNDVRAVQAYWQEHGYEEPYPLVIKPTGYGKGRVIDALLHPNQEPGIALLIVGTKNVLVEQNQESLRSLVLEETGESRFSILPDISGPIIVATWQSIEAYRKKFRTPPEIDLAIVDEVHNAGTKKRLRALKWLQPKKVVGLTATAYRASGNLRAPEHYGFQPIEEITDTLPACIERRWLSPLAGLCIDTEIILPRDVMSGDRINGKRLYRELRHHPDLFASIAHEVGTRFLPTGMKTIIVVNRVLEEACVIYKVLEQMGFKVGLAVNQGASNMLEGPYVTHGSIERYKLPSEDPNAIQVLISPQVIGEGFDAPATECVVWAAPTSSGLRYTQVMGRGARRCPGKAYCLVVDFVYLIQGYGYSMNFAQFFKRSEIKELEGGILYVGPAGSAGVRIPQEYTRGAHVVPIVDLSQQPQCFAANGWLTAHQIGELIGKTSVWVMNRIDTSQGEIRRSQQGRPTIHFPPESVEQLRKVAQSTPPAGNWVTVADVAKHAERSRMWAKKFLENGKFESQTRLDSTGRGMTHFPPTVLAKAAEQAAREKSAGDWVTANKVSEAVGQDFHWTTRWLAKAKIKGEMRRSGEGIMTMHYPRSAIDTLKLELESVADAKEGWITGTQLANILSKSLTWVRVRLAELEIEGEVARDRTNRQVLEFFPGSAVEKLKNAQAAHKEAGDWLTLRHLAEKVNRSTYWVKSALTSLKVSGEIRWAANKQAIMHYPPNSLQKVRQLSEEIPIADENWLTKRQVAQALGQSVSWTNRRIEAFSNTSKLHRNKAGEISPHYPSSVVEELRKEVETIVHAPEGWMTVSEIATELRKMKGGTLIPDTLTRLGYSPEVYHNKVNQKRDYYPPEAVDALRKEFAE